MICVCKKQVIRGILPKVREPELTTKPHCIQLSTCYIQTCVSYILYCIWPGLEYSISQRSAHLPKALPLLQCDRLEDILQTNTMPCHGLQSRAVPEAFTYDQRLAGRITATLLLPTLRDLRSCRSLHDYLPKFR